MASSWLVRAPQAYTLGNDFALWICRFEAYAWAVKISKGTIGDALLALLDNAATLTNYKLLTEWLVKRLCLLLLCGRGLCLLLLCRRGLCLLLYMNWHFAWTSWTMAYWDYWQLCWCSSVAFQLCLLRIRHWDANEVGSGPVHVCHQEWPYSRHSVAVSTGKFGYSHKAVRRLDTALTTWKQLWSRLQLQHINSFNSRRREDETSLQERVAVYTSDRDADSLMWAVHNNMELLQKLLFKLNSDNGLDTQSGNGGDLHQRRRWLGTCWQCWEQDTFGETAQTTNFRE